jgi:hypothetical protein
MSATITTVVAHAAAADAKEIMDEVVADEDAEGKADEAAEILTTAIIQKMYASIVTKMITIRLIVARPRK